MPFRLYTMSTDNHRKQLTLNLDTIHIAFEIPRSVIGIGGRRSLGKSLLGSEDVTFKFHGCRKSLFVVPFPSIPITSQKWRIVKIQDASSGRYTVPIGSWASDPRWYPSNECHVLRFGADQELGICISISIVHGVYHII